MTEPAREPVWLTEYAPDSPLPGVDRVILVRDDEPTGLDRQIDQQVFVTGEQILRWEAAAKAFRLAQIEMGEVYRQAEALANFAEEVVEEEEGRIQEAEDARAAEEALAADAEAELRDGPREWIVQDSFREGTGWRSRGSKLVRSTAHRLSCRYVHDPDGYLSSLVRPARLPEMVQRIASPRPWERRDVPVLPCKVCGGPLAEALRDRSNA